MKIQLIRNATMRLEYGGHTILTDPMLAPIHTLPSFANRSPNPTVGLPIPADEVLRGVDMVILSHLHSDHFDSTAREKLPKQLPILCQPGDEEAILESGFSQVQPVETETSWRGIRIVRTPGQHGTGEVVDLMGPVSGFVLQTPGEPTVYWAGDTVWYEAAEKIIAAFQPGVIITHSSGATWRGSPPIVMGIKSTIAVCQATPQSTVVAVHMEALDHSEVSRRILRMYAESKGVSHEQLLIPEDGEALEIN